jgi:putative transcriptional regulator
MTATPKFSRLDQEILEMANGMHRVGILDDVGYEKITMRQVGDAPSLAAGMISPDDVRALREGANLSQAVFARHLNLTPGYVSQLERGAKRPTGAVLALLNVIRRKGIEVLL